MKLIATDLDGTLLQHGAQEVQQEQFDVIKKIIDAGYIFAAASGREYTNLKRLFYPVKEEMAFLCLNGCLEMYKDEIIEREKMDENIAYQLVQDILSLQDAEVLVSGTFTSYTQPKTKAFIDRMHKKVKIDMEVVDNFETFKEPPSKISACSPHTLEHYQYLFDKYSNDITVQLGGTTWIDCAPKGVNKGVGMKKLCQHLGIDLKDVVMFGDNDNDSQIMDIVGYPVAMANANPKILSKCPYITHSVSEALERILNNQPLQNNPYYTKTIG